MTFVYDFDEKKCWDPEKKWTLSLVGGGREHDRLEFNGENFTLEIIGERDHRPMTLDEIEKCPNYVAYCRNNNFDNQITIYRFSVSGKIHEHNLEETREIIWGAFKILMQANHKTREVGTEPILELLVDEY
jgi:hypothetical protein